VEESTPQRSRQMNRLGHFSIPIESGIPIPDVLGRLAQGKALRSLIWINTKPSLPILRGTMVATGMEALVGGVEVLCWVVDPCRCRMNR